MFRTSPIFLFLFVLLCSCEKDRPPTIDFDSSGAYVYEDCTRPMGETVKVRLIMRTANRDRLSRLWIEREYDGNGSSEVYSSPIRSNSLQTYSFAMEYELHLRQQQGIEKWTFIISDSNGLISHKVLSIQTI